MARPKKSDTPPANERTMLVARNLADAISAIADKNGATVRDVTNQLIAYALDRAEITVEVRTVTISAKS